MWGIAWGSQKPGSPVACRPAMPVCSAWTASSSIGATGHVRLCELKFIKIKFQIHFCKPCGFKSFLALLTPLHCPSVLSETPP